LSELADALDNVAYRRNATPQLLRALRLAVMPISACGVVAAAPVTRVALLETLGVVANVARLLQAGAHLAAARTVDVLAEDDLCSAVGVADALVRALSPSEVGTALASIVEQLWPALGSVVTLAWRAEPDAAFAAARVLTDVAKFTAPDFSSAVVHQACNSLLPQLAASTLLTTADTPLSAGVLRLLAAIVELEPLAVANTLVQTGLFAGIVTSHLAASPGAPDSPPVVALVHTVLVTAKADWPLGDVVLAAKLAVSIAAQLADGDPESTGAAEAHVVTLMQLFELAYAVLKPAAVHVRDTLLRRSLDDSLDPREDSGGGPAVEALAPVAGLVLHRLPRFEDPALAVAATRCLVLLLQLQPALTALFGAADVAVAVATVLDRAPASVSSHLAKCLLRAVRSRPALLEPLPASSPLFAALRSRAATAGAGELQDVAAEILARVG
jgi:hypothetical protein